jgi:hypothetical protein
MQKRTNTIQPNSEQAPVNQLFHVSALATAESRDMVAPNVDTVYSEAFLDLNSTSLVFVKPKTDRFCEAQVMDAYSNTVTILGSGGKMDNPQDEQVCLITRDTYSGEIPEGMIHVPVPTDLAWLLIRTVCNGQDDLPNVTAIQNQMHLVPLNVFLSNDSYIPPDGSYHEEYDFIPSEQVNNMSPAEFFGAANRLMVTNPPAPADAPIIEEIRSVTAGPGLFFDETVLGDNSSGKWSQMTTSANAILNTSYYLEFADFIGKWMYFGDPIGDFGTDYYYRTMIAQTGYGTNPTSVAIYPTTELDSDNAVLSGKNRYILHINQGMLPPVKKPGFWSVTVYDIDSFLIPNELHRYSINDRSNVTYNPDGSLDILLQEEAPDDEGIQNWLPVGMKYFQLYMRMYLPDMDKFKNNWTVPEIVKQ